MCIISTLRKIRTIRSRMYIRDVSNVQDVNAYTCQEDNDQNRQDEIQRGLLRKEDAKATKLSLIIGTAPYPTPTCAALRCVALRCLTPPRPASPLPIPPLPTPPFRSRTTNELNGTRHFSKLYIIKFCKFNADFVLACANCRYITGRNGIE